MRNTVLGAVQPTLFDHARLQSLIDHPPGGERAELVEDVVVAGFVERLCQIAAAARGGPGLELSSFVCPEHEPGSPTATANELGLRNVSL